MQLIAQKSHRGFRANLAGAPLELLTVGVLCACASVVLLAIAGFGPQNLHAHLIQYAGWPGGVLLGFVALAVADAVAHRKRGCGRALVLLGLLLLVAGAWAAYEWSTGAAHRMAYIRVSGWLVLWQVTLGSLLIVIGTGRRLQSFCQTAP